MAVTVLTLGPGDARWLTAETAEALQRSGRLILRTGRHPAAEWLRARGVSFTTFDAYYDRYDDFDEMHRAMAEALLRLSAEGPLSFAVIDAATDGAVAALKQLAPDAVRVLPGLSIADACLARLPFGVPDGLRVIPASALPAAAPDPNLPLLVTELNSRILAGEVKLRLQSALGDEAEAWFFREPDAAPARISLTALDRQTAYDHRCCLYLPPLPLTARDRFVFADLLSVMERLRAPDGCPWDRVQTHESIRRYVIEEAYEVADAIDQQDDEHLADELGDLLLQAVFHASIGRSQGSFDIGDVVTAVCRKMIRRHPRLFGGGEDASPDHWAAWEDFKRQERHFSGRVDAMRDVPRALPALTRAEKVQRKAGAAEMPLKPCPAQTDSPAEDQSRAERWGDWLFAAVNAIRLEGLDPEELLTRATDRYIEATARQDSADAAGGPPPHPRT